MKKPSLYSVVLLNDDYTPMDFVTEMIEDVFKKTHSEALEIMLHVHRKGKGICGVYTFEIAEAKRHMVHEKAREAQYPLQCVLERK